MTEYRFWIRERGRSRNKWHVSERRSTEGVIFPVDWAACGVVYQGISDRTHETLELPSGTLPTDASGVCLHCLRAVEMQERQNEQA